MGGNGEIVCCLAGGSPKQGSVATSRQAGEVSIRRRTTVKEIKKPVEALSIYTGPGRAQTRATGKVKRASDKARTRPSKSTAVITIPASFIQASIRPQSVLHSVLQSVPGKSSSGGSSARPHPASPRRPLIGRGTCDACLAWRPNRGLGTLGPIRAGPAKLC